MAIIGDYATYKIGNQKISYDSVTYYELLLKNIEQEEHIKKLESQLNNSNGNGKVK
jgi:hypothetical protein